MAEMGDGSSCFGFIIGSKGGGIFNVVEVKESGIEGGGMGLFACCDFLRSEIITIYICEM